MPNPKKKVLRKSNKEDGEKEVPEETEQRSRRASTKLVTAATKSALLQTTPEIHKKIVKTVSKVNSSEKKDASPKKNPVRSPSPKKSTPTPRDPPRSSKKTHSKPAKAKQPEKAKSPAPVKKRKAETVTSPSKKKRAVTPDVTSPDDTVRRSRRETTRISTLATNNTSNYSESDTQSRASSTESPKESKKTTFQTVPETSSKSKKPATKSKRPSTPPPPPQSKSRAKEEKKVKTPRPIPAEPQSTDNNSAVARRSARSTTAISTLASTNAASQIPFVVTESSDDDDVEDAASNEEAESDEAPYETSPTPKKSRGRPKADKTPLSPNNPFAAITREYKEQQKIAAKLKRKRKSSLSPTDRPRLLTEAENNKLFDSLFQESTSPEPEVERRPPKRSSSSKKVVSNDQPRPSRNRNVVPSDQPRSSRANGQPETIIKAMKVNSSAPKPTSTKESLSNISTNNIDPSNLKWIKSTSSPVKSPPKIVAPWRQICEAGRKPSSKEPMESNDDDVYEFGGSFDDSNNKGKQATNDVLAKGKTSPERRMFMIAKHGAYSGQLAGLKRKMEQGKEQPRLMFGSPRRDVGRSPEHQSSDSPAGSPNHDSFAKNGSPRPESSPSYKSGSPRIDPSQRVGGLPRLNPADRLTMRKGGAIRGNAGTAGGHQLSLTSLASDYNIVAAVDKHGPVSTGPIPHITYFRSQSPQHSDNNDATPPPQQTVKRKSFLLSRIFSKPPSKDQSDEDSENPEEEEKEPTPPPKKTKKRQSKAKTPPPTKSNRPSRRATKNVSMREASSDSEESNSGDQIQKMSRLDVSQVRGNSSIVCTSCHRDDVALVKQLVKKFGSLTFTDKVGPDTSHVVTGESKRTLSLLKGLLQGCWIVSKDWVLSSLEAGAWVNEEPFEMVTFSPAVKKIRLEKEATNGAFKSELFRDIGSIFISDRCKASSSDLRQLIVSGGGDLSPDPRVARIVVGEVAMVNGGSQHCVNEKWVLDSVQFHSVKPFSDFPL